MLPNKWSGNIKPAAHTPKLRGVDGAVFNPQDEPRSTRDEKRQSIKQVYSWGTVDCAYSQDPSTLRLRLRVANTSSSKTIQALELELAELAFGTVPRGRVLEAGMWGTGGNWLPLHQVPLIARSDQMPPVIFVDFEGGRMAFANEGAPNAPDGATIKIPFTTNPSTRLTYPFLVSFPAIAPGDTVSAIISLRFGTSNDSAQALAGDILKRFREAYPYLLKWDDRRPIGALFLATSQEHPKLNPRGWFLNANDVDTSTDLERWRDRLIQYADTSIAVLKSINAQGMITWDPEGEEFVEAVYYGDPRLTSALAPETTFRGASRLGAIDEYFLKFKAAGLKTGVTLRPQHIEFEAGRPIQRDVENPTIELLAKITYAKQRWGCTLFYIDSTYDKSGALPGTVFESIVHRHPDILVLPENEVLRDFAYSAPLNSFHHHGVTGTPASILEAYPQAFSALMVTTSDDKLKAGHKALVEAVRRGDILIVNAWYGGEHTVQVKSIYEDAAIGRPRR
jgi:hypothetical protein